MYPSVSNFQHISISDVFPLNRTDSMCPCTDKLLQNSVSLHKQKHLCRIQAIILEKVSLHISCVSSKMHSGSPKSDLLPQVSHYQWRSFIATRISQWAAVHVCQKVLHWKKSQLTKLAKGNRLYQGFCNVLFPHTPRLSYRRLSPTYQDKIRSLMLQ